MYFGPDEGSVFRPPSEATSYLLRLTVGCSHNKCTFCAMYKQIGFRICTETEIESQLQAALKYRQHIQRVFLCDGDALVLTAGKLIEVLRRLQRDFPKLQRVSCYASPRNILNKSDDELRSLHEAGLQLLYLGLESGDDALLAKINKGVTAQQAIVAGQRVRQAGMRLSVMIINGLAGKDGSVSHAVRTAAAVTAIQPDRLSALTMMLNRGTDYYAMYQKGQFKPLSPAKLAAEMRIFFENLHWSGTGHCLFRSNHISNLFNLAGTLPQDIPRLHDDCSRAERQLQNLHNWNPLNDVDG